MTDTLGLLKDINNRVQFTNYDQLPVVSTSEEIPILALGQCFLSNDLSQARQVAWSLVCSKEEDTENRWIAEGILMAVEALISFAESETSPEELVFNQDCMNMCIGGCTYNLEEGDIEQAKKMLKIATVGAWYSPHRILILPEEHTKCDGWFGGLQLLRAMYGPPNSKKMKWQET